MAYALSAGIVLVVLLGVFAPTLLAPARSPSAGVPGTVPPSDPRPSPVPPTPLNRSAATHDACNAIVTPTPSAVLIPVTNPTGSWPAGTQVTAAMEVRVSGSGSGGVVTFHFPSMFASFPASGGGGPTIYFPPAEENLSNGSWIVPAGGSRTISLAASTAFADAPAVLSSQKIAVLAAATYGNLTLEVRWHWSLGPASGTPTVGAWSVPTAAASWPNATPSIFYPAPFVQLVATTPTPATIGRPFAVWLDGTNPGSWYFLELEDPTTGQVLQAGAGPNATAQEPYAAEIPLIDYDGYLGPGTYLLHVHDDCGALLYSISVPAVYASSANVSFVVQPSSCGAVVSFDGRNYADGDVARVAPSAHAFALGVSGCGSLTFEDWSTSGALHIPDGSHLVVSGDGTLTVRYR